jgi:hypothetical protein
MPIEALSILDDTYKELLTAVKLQLLAPAPPERLYHYTSLSTFQKIVEGKVMWATEGFYMNDYTELRHSANLILETAERLQDEFAKRTDGRDPFGLMRLAVRADSENRQDLMFLTSFSENGDSLSQWRAYADNGAGVAIEFDLTRLRDSTYPQMPDRLDRPMMLKCVYDIDVQRDLVERLLRGLTEVATSHPELSPDKLNRYTLQKRLGALMLSASQELSPFLKNPGFHEEVEWRTVVRDVSGRASEAIAFRNTNYGPAPYVEMPVGSEVGVPITGVVCGPRVAPAAKRVVRLLLERNNLTWVKPRAAEVSYRS